MNIILEKINKRKKKAIRSDKKFNTKIKSLINCLSIYGVDKFIDEEFNSVNVLKAASESEKNSITKKIKLT